MGQIWRTLDDALPDGLRAFVAPLDVALPTGDVLQPDILVARRAAVTERDVSGVPLLVVEVLSASTRRRDLGDKLTAYRDAGCPAYWIVDPDGPGLRVLELRRGEHVEVESSVHDTTWVTSVPFEVALDPVATQVVRPYAAARSARPCRVAAGRGGRRRRGSRRGRGLPGRAGRPGEASR